MIDIFSIHLTELFVSVITVSEVRGIDRYLMIEVIWDDGLWGLSQKAPKDSGHVVFRERQCRPIDVLAKLGLISNP